MGVRLQVMYYFLGKMFVLQPDDQQSFVREPDHPMLPPGPGLYTIHEPSRLASTAGDMRRAAASQLAGLCSSLCISFPAIFVLHPCPPSAWCLHAA